MRRASIVEPILILFVLAVPPSTIYSRNANRYKKPAHISIVYKKAIVPGVSETKKKKKKKKKKI
jgi:hypothetical protein